jgi:hypothetical protein
MADVKISQLPVATNVLENDNFVVTRNGTNVRIPVATLFTNIPSVIGNNQQTEQITTSGNISISKYISEVVTTNSNIDLILPSGIPGQEKIIVFRNKGTANITITPTNGIGFDSITLTDTGDSVTLRYISNAWIITSMYNFSGTVSQSTFTLQDINGSILTDIDGTPLIAIG